MFVASLAKCVGIAAMLSLGIGVDPHFDDFVKVGALAVLAQYFVVDSHATAWLVTQRVCCCVRTSRDR